MFSALACRRRTGAGPCARCSRRRRVQKLGKGEGQVDIVAWPGYIERGATDKNFDWVTDFEKNTGCKVNVKTAGTSDEMVALMNEGGFDLVTASGDASTRLIRGKKVQPINVDLIPSYKNVDPRLQKAPWHYENGTPLRRALPVGLERADVQHQGLQGQAADQLERGVRGADAARRQEQQGPRAGLRRADLHRRRGAVPDEEEPGAGHQGPVRAERGAVQGGAGTAARPAQDRRQVLARRLRADRRLHQRRRGGLVAAGSSRPTSWARRSSRSPPWCRSKAPPAGPTAR